MKKAKILSISLLGLLLFVPFMAPTSAAPPPAYAGINEEEQYGWDVNVYNQTLWDIIFADNMSYWLGSIYDHDQASTLQTIWDGTLYNVIWGLPADVTPQLRFRTIVDTIMPENTTAGTTFVIGTQYIDVPFYPASDSVGPIYNYIGNDTATFAYLHGYGAYSSTPYWIPGMQFAPKNVNWTEFVALSQAVVDGLVGYRKNTTYTEISNGFSMDVPVMGYENNSLAIRINTTYDANGTLTYNSFEYGGYMLYDYVLTSYESDVVAPVITADTSDFSVAYGYTGKNITWTATDANPNTYTITDNTVEVESGTAWSSGVEVVYDIPDGLAAGNHSFEISFTDAYGNSGTDTVYVIVGAAPAPQIPGFDLLVVLSVFTVASIGLIVLTKRKKK
jgi:hypothetical protein